MGHCEPVCGISVCFSSRLGLAGQARIAGDFPLGIEAKSWKMISNVIPGNKRIMMGVPGPYGKFGIATEFVTSESFTVWSVGWPSRLRIAFEFLRIACITMVQLC